MFDLEKLKGVIALSDLNDKMLEKISTATDLVTYKAGDYIFQKNDLAEYLFSVLEGNVELEIDLDNGTPVYLQGIVPNFTFGISSLIDMDEKNYIKNAKAVVDTKVFRWKAKDLEKIFLEDFELGYLFMKRISKILKTRFAAKEAMISDFYKYMRSS